MASVAKKISTKFKNRYRLIVRKDENLEERISIVLTPMNSLLVISVLIALFGTVIILLLSYTPLSNILPTTANNFSQKERLELIQKIDSLETYQRQVQEQELALRAILMGDGEVPYPTETETQSEPVSAPTRQRGLFTPNPVNYSFFTPVKGVVSDTFNMERKHYAVDVVANKGDVVKSAQQGTIIFSAWNPETGMPKACRFWA